MCSKDMKLIVAIDGPYYLKKNFRWKKDKVS